MRISDWSSDVCSSDLAGGRGKGKFVGAAPDAKGGVRLSKSIDEVKKNAAEMLGQTLVTIQTGPDGKEVNRRYVTDGADIATEYYMSMMVDLEHGRIDIVAYTEANMEMEEVDNTKR